MNFGAIFTLADTWSMHGGAGTGWIPMMVGMVLLWGAIIALIVWSAGSFKRSPGDRAETPLELLERGFAEGAISAEDYRERREVLAGGFTTHRRSRVEA